MTSISDTEVVNAPGGLVELGYVDRNTNQTIINNATAATVLGPLSFISDGSPCIVEFYVPRLDSPAATDVYFLVELDGASPTSGQGRIWNWTNQTASTNIPVSAKIRINPSAGVHTITIKAFSIGSNVTVICASSNWTPAFLRISKIIQASQLLVTQSNAPIVTSLPSGNLVTGQEVYLYTTYGYVRYLWDGSNWVITADNRNISFVAHGSSFQGSTNAFYNFLFNSTTINNGNGYNTSNGRFTAPVTGLYHFSLNARLDGTPAGGYLRAYIWRPDGGLDAWVAPNLHAIFGNNHATDYHTLNVSGLMYLTAGQYVNAGGGHISGASNLLRTESTFTGYLVK